MTGTAEDRRATPRETAVVNRVCLEWWAGDQMRRANGRLLNISERGALLVLDSRPPVGQPVWFHVETPARTDDIAARVVRVDGSGEIGLSFSSPCPYDLYLTATLGVNPCGMLVCL